MGGTTSYDYIATTGTHQDTINLVDNYEKSNGFIAKFTSEYDDEDGDDTIGVIMDTLIVMGIENIDAESISLYPNPSTGEFQISGNLFPENHISVFDNTGKVVYSDVVANHNGTIQLNLQHLSAGVYYLEVNAPKQTGQFRKKVVVQ